MKMIRSDKNMNKQLVKEFEILVQNIIRIPKNTF
jgi:hypothetical protein